MTMREEFEKWLSRVESAWPPEELAYGIWQAAYRAGQASVEAERDALREKYEELIMAVGNKYEGETRHQTALRYIVKAEEPTTMRSVAIDAARKQP
jgi:hypothetical protein